MCIIAGNAYLMNMEIVNISIPKFSKAICPSPPNTEIKGIRGMVDHKVIVRKGLGLGIRIYSVRSVC